MTDWSHHTLNYTTILSIIVTLVTIDWCYMLYCLLIPVLFMIFLIQHILYYQYHTMFTCVPFPYFYTHWEFWLPEFTHPGLWLLHFINQVYEEIVLSEEYGVSLLDHRILWYNTCLPFHSVDFLWFSIYILDSIVVLLIIHGIILSCVGIICNITVTLLPLLLIYITCLGHFRLSVYT